MVRAQLAELRRESLRALSLPPPLLEPRSCVGTPAGDAARAEAVAVDTPIADAAAALLSIGQESEPYSAAGEGQAALGALPRRKLRTPPQISPDLGTSRRKLRTPPLLSSLWRPAAPRHSAVGEEWRQGQGGEWRRRGLLLRQPPSSSSSSSPRFLPTLALLLALLAAVLAAVLAAASSASSASLGVPPHPPTSAETFARSWSSEALPRRFRDTSETFARSWSSEAGVSAGFRSADTHLRRALPPPADAADGERKERLPEGRHSLRRAFRRLSQLARSVARRLRRLFAAAASAR